MTLTRIHVEGFRSLKKVELDLGRVTLLVGSNGSGKSNLLSLLQLVSKTVTTSGLVECEIGHQRGYPMRLFALALLHALTAACVAQSSRTCQPAWFWQDGQCHPNLPEGEGVTGTGKPEPLQPFDFSLDTQRELADRFQPAMALAGADIWPVSVFYCFESGADLMRYSRSDTEHLAGEIIVANADLRSTDLSQLPSRDFIYGIDCPGDNTSGDYQEATWIDRWRAIQGVDLKTAPYPPLHYVHLAWFDRARQLLMIQYWFWYPYNKFAVNHEGDWEHVNVIVDISDEPTLVDVHYYFHARAMRWYKRITRIGDGGDGDHPIVFGGGCGEYGDFGGCYSGGSYPWPGEYLFAAEIIDDDTRTPIRFLHPDDIGIVIMPEVPAVATENSDHEVSWLPLEIYFGQWSVLMNPTWTRRLGFDRPPAPPAFKESWNLPANETTERWAFEDDSTFTQFALPESWQVLYNPGHDTDPLFIFGPNTPTTVSRSRNVR